VEAFVKPYTLGPGPAADVEKTEIVDLDNPPPTAEAELPCVQALEFLADIFEAQGAAQREKEKTEKAVEVCLGPFDLSGLADGYPLLDMETTCQ
jgi:protein farnesyltransferase/geranylgeranyltransferase type-1 subunit alpha